MEGLLSTGPTPSSFVIKQKLNTPSLNPRDRWFMIQIINVDVITNMCFIKENENILRNTQVNININLGGLVLVVTKYFTKPFKKCHSFINHYNF